MMKSLLTEQHSCLRWRIAVSGTVQGVGFRPFIYGLARRFDVAGWVCNTGDGVLLEVEGAAETLQRLLDALRAEQPALAHISEIALEELPSTGGSGFEIRHSEGQAGANTSIPPDIATCAACVADISTPGNRRYQYPFTNCTNCGPRFTIIRAVPYDRPSTTMADFPMCPACAAEYADPGDRRFHAQPNACPVCGPHLLLDEHAGNDADVLARAAALLRDGKILAIKGLGGYHLACDARNEQAVQALRARKGRAGKPFAVMCADLAEARRICEVDAEAEALLLAPERPIVLMPAKAPCHVACDIAPSVAQGTSSLGVMLPYTPLHQSLLAQSPPTLVMTSGNLSEEPIVHRDNEARMRLGPIADHQLSHNRPIHLACDDSVLRPCADGPMIIRRARGYVPRPIEMAEQLPEVLACGGDLKNTFCLTKGKLALLSQHLGDLENVAALEHYADVVEHFCRFFAVQPRIVAHDLHPDYHSTRFARAYGAESPKTLIGVQHHHAHVVACMAEHRLPAPVIGVAFDGTGYGVDGHIWGGEFLLADYADFRRVAHLAYVPLPGGAAAIRRPGRMALAYLLQACGPEALEIAPRLMPGFAPEEAEIVAAQIARKLNTPLTSSMGRLFDAVSALLGICHDVGYEGQAAIELETRAVAAPMRIYPYEITDDGVGGRAVDVRAMIAEIAAERARGVDIALIAAQFHATVADFTARVCMLVREETGVNQVVLSGGVFQNVRLLGMTRERLCRQGFAVARPMQTPINDGGIALGQAMVAACSSKQ